MIREDEQSSRMLLLFHSRALHQGSILTTYEMPCFKVTTSEAPKLRYLTGHSEGKDVTDRDRDVFGDSIPTLSTKYLSDDSKAEWRTATFTVPGQMPRPVVIRELRASNREDGQRVWRLDLDYEGRKRGTFEQIIGGDGGWHEIEIKK